MSSIWHPLYNYSQHLYKDAVMWLSIGVIEPSSTTAPFNCCRLILAVSWKLSWASYYIEYKCSFHHGSHRGDRVFTWQMISPTTGIPKDEEQSSVLRPSLRITHPSLLMPSLNCWSNDSKEEDIEPNPSFYTRSIKEVWVPRPWRPTSYMSSVLQGPSTKSQSFNHAQLFSFSP